MSALGSDPKRRALLDLLLREEGLEPLSIVKKDRWKGADSVPLSFTQQQMWFLDQLTPGNPFYNISTVKNLKGPLDVIALENSLNEIVRRHESLRTTFAAVEGIPAQRIASALTVTLPVVDLIAIPQTERVAQVMNLATEEARRSFDLTKGPLIRFTLLRVDAEEYVLVIVSHHIIMDGLSMAVFYRELAALYESFSMGRPSPLAELPLQYADFVHWQHEWMQGDVLEQHLSYWKNQLRQAPGMLDLPIDRPRAAVQTFRGASQSVELSKSLTERLKDLSRHEGVTLFMTMLAAFQALLSRITGQEDIVVGSPIAGRNRPEVEGLIGLFLNTLVLRTDLSGDPSFRELLGRVRDVVLGAFAHQEVPFEKLMGELQVTRSLSRNTLFQVMLAFRQLTEEENLRLPGIVVNNLPSHMGVAKFDFILGIVDRPETLRCSLTYNSDLFEAATIQRMAGYFRTLLEGIVADPGVRLSALPFLTGAEQQQLLVEWNDTKREYPRNRCVHELFEAQVGRTPEAAAVMFEEERLSYRELDRRANQLAHYLKERGVGPEVLVGICMERSLEMIVGLLGTLKAGGAYLPLDPNHPTERLTAMLQDTGAPVLLTQQRLIEARRDSNPRLPTPLLSEVEGLDSPLKVICLDSEWETISRESTEKLITQVTPENLAYVIYTSGSTGRPKGVEITHRALSNFVHHSGDALGLSNEDRVLQFASISFDTAAEEIFPCLTRGATLVLRTECMIDSVSIFLQKCAKWRATVLDLPTVYWHELTESLYSEKLLLPEQLRLVIIGGEKALPERLEQWWKAAGNRVRLLNTYGPTEATVVATMWEGTGAGPATESLEQVAIGRPISNVQTYIVDRYLNPVPVGVCGELHIGGAGLARGYLNYADPTAEKFIPNPFSDKPGDRLYRTGDLARYLSDGNIEFLDRMDHQVKIRGFRIELGEIEAVLSQHPAVRETVVLAREEVDAKSKTCAELSQSRQNPKSLVAYVVPNPEQAPTLSELRGFLKDKLPDYMVPSAFVFLDSLPLTPNGKVNRKALPILDPSCLGSERSFVAPRAPGEELLANIWADVLKLPRVSVHDSFFDLGGHSLLATQVMSRIHRVLQVNLPLRVLFERPTVAELAKRIEETRGEEQGLAAPPILPVSRDKDLPLSFAQQRLWFLDQYEPNSAVYNIPGALRLRGSLNIRALEQSLDEIIRRHESLRTTFSMVDGEAVQVIAPSLGCSLAVVDLRDHPEGEREEEARRLVREEARRLFDLARGPLFRSQVLRLGEDEHVLLLTLHHIVSDGWSMGVLYRELSVFYGAFSQGEPSPLSELPIQYTDFALWQREWLQGEVLDRQLSYWKKQLEGIPGVLNLPADNPRPAVQSYRGGRQSIELSRELAQGLKQLSRSEGVTLFMTLLAAFQTLLYRITGQEDIVVGSPIANRNRTEIEGLIGFFVNTLALRTNFDGDPTFKELLARVRQTTLEAYEHQDLPFEKLVEELNPERHLTHSPLFQVMFVLQNAPTTNRILEGLSVRPLRIGAETAKFDLTLSMSESIDGLRGSLQYNPDLFDEATVVRMLSHLRVLLEGIIANPDERIGHLSILTVAEEHQLLVEWDGTEKDYPRDRCFHELFEEQVKRSPDAIAVTFEDTQLTYRDLNARANQLARHLGKLGVGREVLVAICIEPSLTLLVALLGTLKAGGAFVPLDPEYPDDRLASMLNDSQPLTIITKQRFAERFAQHGVVLTCLDDARGSIAQESAENPRANVTPEDLAYVIYTSGTTGTPKGVMIEHRSLVNYLYWFNQTVMADKAPTLPATTKLTFDAALKQWLAPLLRAGQVWIVSGEVIREAPVLLKMLSSRSRTGLNCVPTNWHVLLDVIESERTPISSEALSLLLLGGEPLDRSLVVRTVAVFPHIDIWNLYGPTEATANAIASRIDCERSVGLGRPVANAKVALLDANLRRVPIGIVGELYIGGVGLARGYLGRADLTAEKFVSDPFSKKPGARLYKTGDLARYLPDGSMEFLGRIDRQVKIRGFRIELGEIEAILTQHPAVREAVVLAREEFENPKSESENSKSAIPNSQCSVKRLVAYVVPRREASPSVDELRSFTKEKLPAYMVPSTFVFLDAVPLTPNGKIDRRALPAPDQRRPELEEAYVAPRTPVEEMTAEIWAEVLKLEKVGIRDNFFGLGGHSLLATQTMSRICQAFEVEIPLRVLFERPTVAELAKRIEETRGEEQGLAAPPILPVSRDKDLPLSFAQQRLWFLDQYEPNSAVYNIPGALRLRGSLNIRALEQSLDEIIRRHESLRTTFSMVDGEAVQVIAPSLGCSLAVVDLRDHPEGEREEEARRLVREEARRLFDLARGPLFRSQVLRLGEDEHVLLLTLHHIVSDGWSMGVLYRELSVFYGAFSQGEPSPLSELPIQYTDFALWQREWLQGEVLDRQLSYWKKQLEGIPGVLNLPADGPCLAVQSHREARHSFVLSKDLTEQLKALSRKEGMTLYMTLLAGFKVLLFRYTGQDDLVVGSPIAGRNRPEIEVLIGFFVNTLVLRTDLSSNPSFRELLRRVREVCLGAYAHQELPFQKLVEVLHTKRDTSPGSLAQVFFAFQNVPRQPLKLPGLTVTPVRTDLGSAKAALTLFMWEREQCLAGSFSYAADLFNAATINRMTEHFQTLLNAVVADPERRLLDLAPFLEQSRSELLEAIHWATEQSWHFEADAPAGHDQGEI